MLYNVNKLLQLFVTGHRLESRDIVDGHRQKTLQLLWTLIFVFKVTISCFPIKLVCRLLLSFDL